MNLYLLTPKEWKKESLFTAKERQKKPFYYECFDDIFTKMIVAAATEDEAKLIVPEPPNHPKEDWELFWVPANFVDAKLIGENTPYEAGTIVMSDYIEEEC